MRQQSEYISVFSALANCEPGTPDMVYLFVQEQGIPLESDYPAYTGIPGKCQSNKVNKVKLTSVTRVQAKSVSQIKAAVSRGPVLAGIDATSTLFQVALPEDFIIDEDNVDCSPENINHSVVIVGYTDEYFIVMDSLGTDVGYQGFYKFAMRDNSPGPCGINMFVEFPYFN